MNEKKFFITLFLFFSIAILIAGMSPLLTSKSPSVSLFEYLPQTNKNTLDGNADNPIVIPIPTSGTIAGFTKFTSEAEFKEYLQKTEGLSGRGFGVDTSMIRAFGTVTTMEGPSPLLSQVGPTGMSGGISEQGFSTNPDRVSGTNVQVEGIDEPDIVKTDGQEIYISKEGNYYARPAPEPQPMMQIRIDEESDEPSVAPSVLPEYYPYTPPKTKIARAFPPADLKKIGSIDQSGTMLLSEEALVILSNDGIYGYKLKKSSVPSQSWQVKYGENTSLITARLVDEKVYLITSTYINRGNPCPIRPLLHTSQSLTIVVPCTEIYHPATLVSSDAMYHITSIDTKTGAQESSLSFLGAFGQTVYMSPENIYLAYQAEIDRVELMSNFVKENPDVFPVHVVTALSRLHTYDISESAKLVELESLLSTWQNSLHRDERLRIENEIQNRMATFSKKRKRDFQRTEIVKIDRASLRLVAVGDVPGRLLNQFSLDEFGGNLRVAVSISSQNIGWRFGWNQISEDVNDIYILNSQLKQIGSIEDLGLTERIFSARFLGDKGYLVTFRQIDPFYVLDLRDPKNPKMTGELKIPGFSSYLHPIAKDRILGIGKEGAQVKISLFDVSDPKNPREADKYILKEFWTEVASTHHAFLQDEKHGIFFLPGNQGGYIFSYKGDSLKLERAVSGISANRALYINDYLYLVGYDKIVIFNENDWQRVKEIDI